MPQGRVVPLEIVTPKVADRLADILSGYDIEEYKNNYLMQGFREGFRIHYDGGDFTRSCKNLKSATDFTHIIDEKVRKELQAGRIAGPFDTPSYNTFHVSPIGVVPKKEPGKFRMIYHRSCSCAGQFPVYYGN